VQTDNLGYETEKGFEILGRSENVPGYDVKTPGGLTKDWLLGVGQYKPQPDYQVQVAGTVNQCSTVAGGMMKQGHPCSTVADGMMKQGNPCSTVADGMMKQGNPCSTVADGMMKQGHPCSTVADGMIKQGNPCSTVVDDMHNPKNGK
jgi:hypothetical protein